MNFYLKAFEDIVVEFENQCVWITLNRPEASNAYSTGMVRALVEVLKYADLDNDVRVMVITGAGKNFCAGGDVKAMKGKTGMFAGESNQLREAYQAGIQQIPLTISNLKNPLIAMVKGAAVGAGQGRGHPGGHARPPGGHAAAAQGVPSLRAPPHPGRGGPHAGHGL
jgi:enoyl-CoA hydratase/carnithine racemase